MIRSRFPNTLPLSKVEYRAAREQIEWLQRLVIEAKRPAHRTSPAPVSPSVDLAAEIAKLSELHDGGALDDDEFQQAKQALIARASA